jgi:hypothetical protein
MIVTIHQPSYLPWIPFLEKGLRSDVFVMLDNVQFEKNSEQNRNRIKTEHGELWLTVPVSRNSETLLCDIEIPRTETAWIRKHRRTIEQNYRKAPYYPEVAEPLFALLQHGWTKLLDLNLAVDRLFLEMAGFGGRIVRASELNVSGSNWERLLNICRALDPQTYLSGISGHQYLNLDAFEAAGIQVLFQQYQHRDYPQRFPQAGFTPRLSALDLFMNVGIGAAARERVLAGSCWLTASQMALKTTGCRSPT